MSQENANTAGKKTVIGEMNWANKYRKGWKKAVQLFKELEAENQKQKFASKFSSSCAENTI